MIRYFLLIISLAFTCKLSAQEIRCTVDNFNGSNRAMVKTVGDTTEIHGNASIRMTPQSPINDGEWVLELEYFCVGGVDQMTLAPGPQYSSATARSLKPFGHSETFSPYVARLRATESPQWVGVKDLRLDLRMKADGVLQIRNVRLRRERAGEFDAVSKTSVYAADSDALREYLSRSYRSQLTSVSVGEQEISVAGKVAGSHKGLFLGDIPMETLVTDVSPDRAVVSVIVNDDGTFQMEIPRFTSVCGRSIDRLTSRWQLVRRSETGDTAISHARYADAVACRDPDLPAANPSSKKGLGGWSSLREPKLNSELQSLGIAAVTVNVFKLHQYVSTKPRRGFTPFTWQGRKFFANEKQLQQLDKSFREAEKHGVMVSAILLVTNPGKSRDAEAKLLAHPDVDLSGKYAMPNVTSTEGIAYYGAILNLMAERWSRDDGVHGRVHHWIVHNEVDFGWVWTNAGKKSDIAYMDLYQRSLRLVDLIARQYDPHARAWITLTHHWGQTGTQNGYGSKRMLELLVQFCKAEGDFPWALAYHPYPQSLFDPRTWEDELATFEFDTAKITPKNLEVLDAYMKLPKMRYRDTVRPVHLSENGFNSKDYAERSLTDQAAGMALAWKKMQNLSSIESWQYHNWVDNRREGGLRIGLRKFRDDQTDPLGKKPIWHLYQALGTPQEDAIASPYLKTIGVESWDEIMYDKPIQ